MMAQMLLLSKNKTKIMKITLEMNSQLSKNLSYKEATQSITATRFGIDNTPTFEQLAVMKYLVVNFFQPLRDAMKVMLKVNSFFRCKKLNQKIGGSKSSDHMVEWDVAAIDLDDTYCRWKGIYNRDIFQYILDNMNYHKLIWEYVDEPTPDGQPNPKWVHISFSTDPKKNQEKRTLFTNGNGYEKFDRKRVNI